MSTRELTCIGCPIGCALVVELEDKEVISVSGNTCKIGENYGKKECTNPTRVVTSSVLVSGGENAILPVKTERDIPKDKSHPFGMICLLSDKIKEEFDKEGKYVISLPMD